MYIQHEDEARVVYVFVTYECIYSRLPCLGCLNWSVSYKLLIDHAGQYHGIALATVQYHVLYVPHGCPTSARMHNWMACCITGWPVAQWSWWKWKKIPWVTHGNDLRHQTHESLMGLIYVTFPMSDSWEWFTTSVTIILIIINLIVSLLLSVPLSQSQNHLLQLPIATTSLNVIHLHVSVLGSHSNFMHVSDMCIIITWLQVCYMIKA